MNTAQRRGTILVDSLSVPSEIRMVVTDMDRLTVGGVVPREKLSLPSCPALGTEPFIQRRELGVVNLGEAHAEIIGDTATASRRRLSKFIHAGGVASCQLVMGRTRAQHPMTLVAD